jgi:hypothetical protein
MTPVETSPDTHIFYILTMYIYLIEYGQIGGTENTIGFQLQYRLELSRDISVCLSIYSD